MLSEGTLLSGGDKDRKIAAWDSLQNYKRITDTKVSNDISIGITLSIKSSLAARGSRRN